MWVHLPLIQLHDPKVDNLGIVLKLLLRRLSRVNGTAWGRFLAKCAFSCQLHLELIVRRQWF